MSKGFLGAHSSALVLVPMFLESHLVLKQHFAFTFFLLETLVLKSVYFLTNLCLKFQSGNQVLSTVA